MIATITKMPPEKSSKPLHKAFKSFHKQVFFKNGPFRNKNIRLNSMGIVVEEMFTDLTYIGNIFRDFISATIDYR